MLVEYGDFFKIRPLLFFDAKPSNDCINKILINRSMSRSRLSGYSMFRMFVSQ